MPQDIRRTPYFDSLLLFCLMKELKELEGEKVKAVKRDGEHTVVLCFAHRMLCVSTNPVLYRAFLAPGPATKTMRKHPFDEQVRFLRIAGVKQHGLDRIFSLGLSKSGIHPSCHLVFELIGPSSNAFLLDETYTVRASHRTSRTGKSDRVYQQDGIPFNELVRLSAEGILIDLIQEDRLKEAIAQQIKRIPPWLNEMMRTMEEAELRNKLGRFLKQPEPYIHHEGGKPCCVSPLKISSRSKPCESFSAAIVQLYEYYEQETARDRIKREIKKELKHCRKIKAKLAKDQEHADLAGTFKKKGELILLHIGEIKKGTPSITVPDPYDEERHVNIELDPAKTPARNAADYFRKARKAEKSKETIKRRLEGITKEIARLEKRIEGIDSLPQEALRQTISTSRPAKRGREQEVSRPYRTFRIRSGRIVLVGRNSKENEHLTFHVAKPKDLFFHVREAPGSHTILVNDGSITRSDIQEAASIAAHFSKAKHATIVPVSYTERRYVRKSRKLAAGKVIISHEKTVFAEPSPPREHQVKEKNEGE